MTRCATRFLGLLSAFVLLVGCTGDVAPVDAGDSSVARMDAATAVVCEASQTACSNRCTDTMTDRDHCGTCGTSCGRGEFCVAGMCRTACPTGQTVCGTRCVALMTDSASCGMCDHACGAGEVCSAGACGVQCAAGTTECAYHYSDAGTGGVHVPDGGALFTRYCADTANDRANCGTCGNACVRGQACVRGACASVCPATERLCGNDCVDINNDPNHCGACTTTCGAGQTCLLGNCRRVCPAGETACGTACAATMTDPGNCGACGHACTGGLVCVAGACVATCGGTQSACAGRCVDFASDMANCGRCSNACTAGSLCMTGQCVNLCTDNQTACAVTGSTTARCVDTSTDPRNCGGCGIVCAAGQSCLGGACGAACAVDQMRCAGTADATTVCSNVNVDPRNCGGCGIVCGDGQSCVARVCSAVFTDAGCTRPSAMCGPNCTDLRNDNANCGACGTVCAANLACVNSQCVAPCAAGQSRCGNACVAVAMDRNNCGACGNVCAGGTTCTTGTCTGEPTLMVTSGMFGVATGDPSGACFATDADAVSGAETGGLAVSSVRAFATGATATGTWALPNLTSPAAAVQRHTFVFADAFTGTLYVLLDANGGELAETRAGLVAVTQFGVLDATTGALTTARLALSQPITVGHDVGIFAGYGRVVIHTGDATLFANAGDAGTGDASTGDAGAAPVRGFFAVRLTTGAVTALTTGAAPAHASCPVGAYWGVAEYSSTGYAIDFFEPAASATTGPRVLHVALGTTTSVPYSAPINGVTAACSLALRPQAAGTVSRWVFRAHGAPVAIAGSPSDPLAICSVTTSSPP